MEAEVEEADVTAIDVDPTDQIVVVTLADELAKESNVTPPQPDDNNTGVDHSNPPPDATPTTIKRPARQVRFKLAKKVKRSSPLPTPPLTRGKRRLSTSSIQPPFSNSQDTDAPTSPPDVSQLLEVIQRQQKDLEKQQEASKQQQEDIQRLYTAVANLRCTVQAYESDKQDEVSAISLAEDMGKMEKAVMQRLDKTDKKVDGLASEVKALDGQCTRLLGRVEGLAEIMSTYTDTQKHLQERLDEGFAKYKEREARLAAIAGPEAAPPTYHQASSSFYITGIPALRSSMARLVGHRADPVVVIAQLMKEVGAVAYVSRIQLLGKQARDDRLSTRAAIVHLTTPFHKTTAMVRIKTLLSRHGLSQVVIEDCFPTTKVEEARHLREEGAKLKEAGTIHRFRVINRSGEPVMQVAATHRDKYSDYVPSAGAPEAVVQQHVEAAASTGDKEAQGQAARASTSPKPDAGLSRGGNARLATPHHQTEAGTGQSGDRRMEKERRSAGERKNTQLTPSSLHAEGGERQRPVSGPLQGTVNGKANSATNEANKLMAMAGYSQPASSSTTKDGHLGARPKIPSAGHTNLRD